MESFCFLHYFKIGSKVVFLDFGVIWGAWFLTQNWKKTDFVLKFTFWKWPHSRTEWPFSKKTPMKHMVSIRKTHSKFRIGGFVFRVIWGCFWSVFWCILPHSRTKCLFFKNTPVKHMQNRRKRPTKFRIWVSREKAQKKKCVSLV